MILFLSKNPKKKLLKKINFSASENFESVFFSH